MPNSTTPIYRSKNCEYAVTTFQRHPAYLALSASTPPHLLFPNTPIPQSAWESFTQAEMQRVDAGLIAPRTLLANLGYLRNIHMDTWGVDPPFFKSPLYRSVNGSSVRENGSKSGSASRVQMVDVTTDNGLNAKGLKHLVRYALERKWINDSTQWKALFPLSQSQVSAYIKSVFLLSPT
jgi:hypothetical protein